MKTTKRVRSVMPVYFIALVWVYAAFVIGIHGLMGYVTTTIFSVVAFFVGRAIFPDKFEEVEVPDPAPAKPEDPEVAALMKERERAISEMRRLNDNIEDEDISAQIDKIEQTTGRIFDHVLAHPEKKSSVRRFMDYYLPTVLKLLNQYDRMDSTGSGGENVSAAKEKISSMLTTVSAAFDKQLDSLFQNDYMDIAAEVSVLEQMMNQDGLTDSGLKL